MTKFDFDINAIMKARYAKIQKKFTEEKIDVFLGTSLRSITYAGNVYQSFAWYVNTCILIPAKGEPMLVGPLSDVNRIAAESWVSKVESWNPPFGDIPARRFEDVLIDYFKANKFEEATIGIEGNISYLLRTALEKALPKAKFVIADNATVDCMVVKDEMELAYMRKVGELCTLGFETLRDNIRPGISETELVGIMEARLRKAGCTGWWVPNQAGCGEKVTLDHYPSDASIIQPNHYVKAGVHATYRLYCGDICNVFALRKAEPEYVKLCKTSEDAAQKTLDAMKPGVKCNELYFVYQKYMADHGYEKCCDWYLGHGLGTAHQAPLLSPHDPTVLQKDMVVVLNALTQTSWNSYINEVMVIITDDGYELITHNPLGLVQL